MEPKRKRIVGWGRMWRNFVQNTKLRHEDLLNADNQAQKHTNKLTELSGGTPEAP